METRKVQLSGGTTYTISLPKSWAREQDIQAGVALSLHPNDDGSLLVDTRSGRQPETRTRTVDVTEESNAAVRQRIHAMHAVGFDEVTLVDRNDHDPAQRSAIEETVRTLSGFELLESDDRRIKLTNLVDADNVDVRKSTLRLRLVTLGMHRDAMASVLQADTQLADRVTKRDDEADKLFAMVTRHFRRALTDLREVEKLEYGRADLFEFYYVARQFERTADHSEKIARFSIDPGVTVPAEFVDRLDGLAASSRTVIDTAADVILADAPVAQAHLALRERDSMIADLRELESDLYDHDDPAQAHVIGLLLNSLRRTAEYGANVAGMAVQQDARQTDQSS